jgi:hypothetical protein
VAYQINGWKRENTTLPLPTGIVGTNKRRLPFLGAQYISGETLQGEER